MKSNKFIVVVALLFCFLYLVLSEEPKKEQPKTEVTTTTATPPSQKISIEHSQPEEETVDDSEFDDDVPSGGHKSVAEVLKEVNDSKLKDIFIRNMKISEEEARQVAKVLETNPNIDRLVLTKNEGLTLKILNIMTDAISKCKGLRVLGITKNKIGDEGVSSVAEDIKNHANLQKFYVYNTELTSKGVEILTKSLLTLPKFMKLVIIENKIGDEGGQVIGSFLPNSKVSELILRDCDIKDQGFKALGEALKKSPQLVKVDLSENLMSLQAGQNLAEGLQGNTHLTHLEISFNGLDHKALKPIATALLTNKALKRLDLSENKIGDEGAKEIAAVLEKDTAIEKIDISNNKITTPGSKALLEALEKNKNLKRLFYYRNEADDSLKELFAKNENRVKSEYTDSRADLDAAGDGGEQPDGDVQDGEDEQQQPPGEEEVPEPEETTNVKQNTPNPSQQHEKKDNNNNNKEPPKKDEL